MKLRIKDIIKYPVFFAGALALMLAFLVLSAKVDRESVQGNFEESAEYLCEDKVFIYKEEDVEPSLIDRYADSILLNIAYNFEQEKPLESVMWSSYYFTLVQNENNNLYDAVFRGKEKNQQYLRYWHGSAGVVRILLMFLNLRQIYVMHAIVLIVLFAVLMVLLVRNKCIFEAVAFALSLVAVSVWYVPFSLEYTWTFLCLFVFSIASVVLVRKGKDAWLGVMFMLAGMVTNYLDFLTTETITLTIPLILVICLKGKMVKDGRAVLSMSGGQRRKAGKSADGTESEGKLKNSNRSKGSEWATSAETIKQNGRTKDVDGVKNIDRNKKSDGVTNVDRNRNPDKGIKLELIFVARYVVIWGIGYAGMWLAKWAVASIVLGENAMPYVTEHIEERLSGELEGVSFLRYFWLAFYNNISFLFPMDYGTGGVIVTGIVILVIIYFAYVYRKKKIEWGQILLLGLIGLVPIVRFLVLRNHSALHCFFTHRALMATVMAVLLVAWHIFDPQKLRLGRRKKH